MKGLTNKISSASGKKKKSEGFNYGSYIYISTFFISSVLINVIFTVQYLRANMLYKEDTPVRHIIVNTLRTPTYDMTTDNSLTKFVTNTVAFKDLSYVPVDLERLSGEKNIFDSKGTGRLRMEAKQALLKMSEEFNKVFDKPIVVVSSYRSYAYQKGIKDRGCPDNLCAKAGYSEHQSGLAVDLWEASTEKSFMSKDQYRRYYYWLDNRAHVYGFTNTYQKGLYIDGYEIEPWHWRYVGVGLASQLKTDNQTIAEYYNLNK